MARAEIGDTVASRSGRPLSGASVQVNSRSGSTATVYSAETGTGTLTNPLTTDSYGRIEGWLNEGSYDLVVTANGQSYTQRFEAIKGGPISGGTVTVTDTAYAGGAKGDGVTDDTAAIVAAHAAATVIINGVTIRRPLYFPAGRYIVSATLTPVAFSGDDFHWIGAGRTLTYITIKDSVNVPILDTSTFPNKCTIEHMTFGCWDTTGRATHTTNTFPILKLTSSYISTLNNVAVINAPGDGVQIGNGSVSPPADAMTFFDCMITTSLGHGIYNDRSESMKVIGGAIESNTYYDIYVKGNNTTTYDHGIITGTRFEAQSGRAGIYLERTTGYSITGNYFNGGVGVYLDENSHNNVVTGNQFLTGAMLHDAGFLNTTAPNDGVFNPLRRPSHFHYPASRVSDGDGTSTGTTFWTGRNRGGSAGVLHKEAPPSSETSISFDETAGRGAPLAISPNTANGYSAFQDITVVAADTYLFEVFWMADPPGGSFQIQLTDTAVATVYYDSGTLTRAPNTFHWRLSRASFVFTVPAAVTTVRVLLSATSASIAYLDRVDMIKLPNPNGGMEGVYAAGVCANWAVNATNGAPTKAQETTIVRPAMIGASVPTGTQTPSSQKLAVSNTTDYIELSSSPTLDTNRLYLLRGFIYVASGAPAQATIAWGTGGSISLGQYSKFTVRPSTTGQWEAVSRIFRPSSANNKLLLSLLPGAAITAYYDDISVVPLRELLTEKTAFSNDITLSGAATTQAVVVPSVDSVLRRITVVYTVASSANAGVAINVGIYGTAAYYGTVTSAINTAQGTQAEVTLLKTDIVAGRPVVVTCVGGKVGVGNVQVALEYE